VVLVVVVVLAPVDSGAVATGVSPTMVEQAAASRLKMTRRPLRGCFRAGPD
jgi:hypothetical protein